MIGASRIIFIAAAFAVVAAAAKADQFDQAVAAYGKGDYAQARQLWEQSLAAGDWEAARSLGTLARKGLGQAADPVQAVRYYQMAVEHGIVAAEPNLAEMYLTGQGVPKDEARARALLSHAADQGSAPAKFRLSELEEAKSRGEPPPALTAPVGLLKPEPAGISPQDSAPPPPAFAAGPASAQSPGSSTAPVSSDTSGEDPMLRVQIGAYPDENTAAQAWLDYNLPGLDVDVDSVDVPGLGRQVRLWAIGPASILKPLCGQMATHGQWCQGKGL